MICIAPLPLLVFVAAILAIVRMAQAYSRPIPLPVERPQMCPRGHLHGGYRCPWCERAEWGTL